MYRNIKLFGMAALAMLMTVGMANAQLSLVPNGDFEMIDGDSWRVAASPGTNISFPTSGGNGDGYGVIDANGGTWGGVFVAEGGSGVNPAEEPGLSLADYGLAGGDTATFSWDQIDLGGNGAIAGIKIESWLAGAFVSDSGDQLLATTGNWTTHTFDYTFDATADSFKVVLVQNQGFAGGGHTGFDNVGIVTPVPEPASAGIVALGLIGLVSRRRR